MCVTRLVSVLLLVAAVICTSPRKQQDQAVRPPGPPSRLKGSPPHLKPPLAGHDPFKEAAPGLAPGGGPPAPPRNTLVKASKKPPSPCDVCKATARTLLGNITATGNSTGDAAAFKAAVLRWAKKHPRSPVSTVIQKNFILPDQYFLSSLAMIHCIRHFELQLIKTFHHFPKS